MDAVPTNAPIFVGTRHCRVLYVCKPLKTALSSPSPYMASGGTLFARCEIWQAIQPCRIRTHQLFTAGRPMGRPYATPSNICRDVPLHVLNSWPDRTHTYPSLRKCPSPNIYGKKWGGNVHPSPSTPLSVVDNGCRIVSPMFGGDVALATEGVHSVFHILRILRITL